MKKKVIGLLIASLMIITAGCAKAEPAQTQAPETTAAQIQETEPAKETESAVVQKPGSEEESTGEKTYESKDGWEISYYPELFILEEKEGEVSLSYQGDAAGSDVITISYHPGKLPSEVLYEKTADIPDEKIDRSEGWFGSFYPEWSFTREIKTGAVEPGLGETLVGTEHNDGTLLVDILYYEETDDDRNMTVSDDISGVLGTLEFTDHEPQKEFDYYPGIYVRKCSEEIEGEEVVYEEQIVLNDDHTGTMSFQDDIEIIWSSYELITESGDERYEFNIEGDSLYLLDPDFGNQEFIKE